jgi:hypothetical protein
MLATARCCCCCCCCIESHHRRRAFDQQHCMPSSTARASMLRTANAAANRPQQQVRVSRRASSCSSQIQYPSMHIRTPDARGTSFCSSNVIPKLDPLQLCSMNLRAVDGGAHLAIAFVERPRVPFATG